MDGTDFAIMTLGGIAGGLLIILLTSMPCVVTEEDVDEAMGRGYIELAGDNYQLVPVEITELVKVKEE